VNEIDKYIVRLRRKKVLYIMLYMALNQPISVYLPAALKARVSEVMEYYGAKTAGKLLKRLLEQAIHDMELAQQSEANDRVLTIE
jgi:hypothetical protein